MRRYPAHCCLRQSSRTALPASCGACTHVRHPACRVCAHKLSMLTLQQRRARIAAHACTVHLSRPLTLSTPITLNVRSASLVRSRFNY